MERLGVFGGTFNPIHLGHLNLVRCVARELKLDKVLLIPTFIPPHKQASELADGFHRLEMCRLAAAEDRFIEVSDLELKRGGASYTYLTLEELHRAAPDRQLFLIVGGDMLRTFHQWKNWKSILELSMLCAAARTEQEYAELEQDACRLSTIGKGCCLLTIPILEISSTEIRRQIRMGMDTGGCLDRKVADYITDKGLYK